MFSVLAFILVSVLTFVAKFLFFAALGVVVAILCLRHGFNTLHEAVFHRLYFGVANTRSPDVILKDGKGGDYMHRWWVIPRNKWFNIYLHQFHGDDPSVPHDHPWWSVSYGLDGTLREYDLEGQMRYIPAGKLTFRGAKTAHRLELPKHPSTGDTMKVWTLFITGPRIREWGFYCPKGWLHWTKFGAGGQKDITGCGELA